VRHPLDSDTFAGQELRDRQDAFERRRFDPEPARAVKPNCERIDSVALYASLSDQEWTQRRVEKSVAETEAEGAADTA
jgi:hypothetical protein